MSEAASGPTSACRFAHAQRWIGSSTAPRDDRLRLSLPPEQIRSGFAHVGDESGTEAGKACPLGLTDARVDDAEGSRFEEHLGKLLGGHVAPRIQARAKPATPEVVKLGAEIRQVIVI